MVIDGIGVRAVARIGVRVRIGGGVRIEAVGEAGLGLRRTCHAVVSTASSVHAACIRPISEGRNDGRSDLF